MDILLYGIGGAMGKTVLNSTNNQSDMHIVCGVDKFYSEKTINGIPVYPDCSNITEKVDCIIDFSVHSAIFDYLPYAVEKSIPCVIAPTGQNEEEGAYILETSKKIPIFKTGNLSVGINLLQQLVKKATAVLGTAADIEIVETHHNQKKDAPSGTALMLANAAKTQRENAELIYGRAGNIGKRNPNEIAIHAVRGGTVVGKHSVMFLLNNEVITLSHEAESKAVFANGALTAANFIVRQQPGLYDMSNILEE